MMSGNKNKTIKIFNGYGHQGDLILFGQVRQGEKIRAPYTFSLLSNIFNIAKLFFIKPLPFAKVRLQWEAKNIYATADQAGFFKLEWSSEANVPAGWIDVSVDLVDEEATRVSGTGKLFVPHITQFAFVSDIDDTVLISHTARTGKKLRTLFLTDPLKRKTFSDVVKFYNLLSVNATDDAVPNPFFYVSSSEWNLYDYLVDFFRKNELPEGSFLLNEFKRWYQLLNFGGNKHEGKHTRIERLLTVFPAQRFVLLGDNSQQDPVIYTSLANKYPSRIRAIYIRVIDERKRQTSKLIFDRLDDKSIEVLLFAHTNEAIEHARSIGLIEK